MTDLRSRVFSALDIAIKENEYVELLLEPPTRVAVDITSYDAGLEGEDIDAVAEIVRDYQEGKK